MSDTPDDEREPLAVNPERRVGGRGARTREPGRPASRAEPTERTSARRRIGIRELRQHASVYVDLAEKGYTVDITNRGRLVAQLVPVFEPGSPLERLIASGVIEPAEEPGGVADIDPYPSSASGRLAASRLLGQAREGQAQAAQVQAAQVQAEQVQAEERR
jgi:antitoxin (DNA-binding transcriptional repressor) of toxin-antitoxin stability system